MPDAATLAVLRDVVSLTVTAIVFGFVAYAFLRKYRFGGEQVESGLVVSRAFSLADIYAAALIAGILLMGLDSKSDGAPAAEATVSIVLVNVVFTLSLCVMLLLYLVVMRGLSPADLFGLRRLSVPKAAGIAFLNIVPLYFVVAMVAAVVTFYTKDIWPDTQPQEAVKAFRGASNLPLKVMMGIAAVVVAPIVEETVFRGFIYGVLKRYTDGWFAALCSASLFAVVHMHVGSFVPLFFLALGFCAAYERTGSLLVPMWMHAFFNGLSTTLLLLYPDGPK